jgi:hypothetical protein
MQKITGNYLDKFLTSFENGFRWLFMPDTPKKHPWFSRLWLAGLFTAGIILWGIFFNWGVFALTLKDWGKITGPRLALLQDAIKKNSLPLHINDTGTLQGITDRYLAIPDQVLSPQVILLRIMSITRFIFVDVIFLYTVGFLALLWFLRKFSLSLISFSILFLLFNFNGHILAHYAIGHFTWGGYFLFPWFAALAFCLVEGERGWGWIAKMSLLLFAMFLQGSFHQFVWCLIFLAFLALIKRTAFMTVVGGALFALLISMVRILPPALMYGKFYNVYLAGYQNLNDIWFGMVNILETGAKVEVPMMAQATQRWELTLYTGLAGALFLVYFGIYRWLKRLDSEFPYLRLAIPVFGTFLLSFDQIYKWVRLLHIPLLEGERVSARIISLPFVFVLLFAAIEFQHWLNQPRKTETPIHLALIGLILIGGQDLWKNFKSWLPSRVAQVYPPINFQRSAYFITNHSDPPYISAIAFGAAISILSIALVLFLAFRRRQQREI